MRAPVTVVLLATLAGCVVVPASAPEAVEPPAEAKGVAPRDAPTLDALLAAPDAAFDPARAAALLAAEGRPDADVDGAVAAIDALAARIAAVLPRHPRPAECLATAAQVLTHDAGLAADPDDPEGTDPDNLHLDRVLARRRGYCVSLSAVWLGVGARLGWPLRAVRLPGHFLVRWDDGTTRANVETTDWGASHPDARYRARYRVHPTAEAAGTYLASLPPRAVCAEICNNRGVLAQRAGDAAEAERWLDRALALAPGHPTALYNRAVVRQERGDAAGARADLDACLAADPGHAFALVNRADVRRLAGDLAGAEADLAAASAADPGYGGAAVARALFALDRGDLAAAGPLVAEAERRAPADARTWVAKSRWLRLRGECGPALLAANQALVHDRRHAEAWGERALAYAALGNLPRALESWDAAVERAPARVDLRRNRAVTLAKAGRPDAALADLRVALDLAPDWPPIHEALGKVLLATGDRAGARAHLRRYLSLAPDGPAADEVRALVERLVR